MNKNANENQAPGNFVSDYFDRLDKSVGANRDTRGLGAMGVGPFVIGSVDAISGEGGEEMPEFVATRHELKELAEYWASERIEHDFDWFLYQSTGSSEWRWSAYINRRLNRLGEILGEEAMRSVWEAAIGSFRKHRPKITDEDWHIFTEGTDEEQEAWRDKVFGEQATAKEIRSGGERAEIDAPAGKLELGEEL
jgi:hypothetical protein